MTTEKYLNVYRNSRYSIDEIRGLIRDLDDPGSGLSRETVRQKRSALEQLLREKLRAQLIT